MNAPAPAPARVAPSGYAMLLPRPPGHAPLTGRLEVDTAIVGGGLAGLNTALSLAEAGHRDVALLEAQTLGFGASGRNGGFVFAGYSLDEASLLRRVGRDHALRLYRRSVGAVTRVRRRIAAYAIDCAQVDAGVIWANWFRDPGILRRRQQLLADVFGSHWQWLPKARVRELVATERYGDALFEPDAMHINPLAYVRGVGTAAARMGVHVHEGTPVRSLARDGTTWRLGCDAGSVRCRNVVLACGGYRSGLDREVDQAVLPIATYALMSESAGARLAPLIKTRAAVYDTRFAFDYYRVLDEGRLLWGGRISIRNRAPAAVQRLLQRDITRVYPQLSTLPVAAAWSGLMSYARHQMPQIGTRGNGLYWAQAFGGHGLAPTTVAGDLLAAAIAGDTAGLEDFACFGLENVFGRLGLAAAQASYAWLQGVDRARTWRERRTRAA